MTSSVLKLLCLAAEALVLMSDSEGVRLNEEQAV